MVARTAGAEPEVSGRPARFRVGSSRNGLSVWFDQLIGLVRRLVTGWIVLGIELAGQIQLPGCLRNTLVRRFRVWSVRHRWNSSLLTAHIFR